jgi:outer membrane receptor for ferrienterochelin and colicins
VPGLADVNSTFARVWDLRTTLRTGAPGAVALRADVHAVRERQRWPIGGGFSGFNDNRGVTGWVEASRPAGSGTVTGRLFGQDYHHLFRSARGTAPIAGGDEDLQVEQLWKATVTYSATLGGHSFDLGSEASTRTIRSPDKILEDRASDRQFDLFAQDAWAVKRMTLSAGARLTLNDRWGKTVSPTVGASVLANSALRFRGSLGRGFRAPSFKELAWDFANLGAGYTVRGFEGLEPAQSWNVSAGVDWAPSNRTGLGIEVFDNRIDNLIETTFVGNEPGGLLIYSPRNVRRARTSGVEVTGYARTTQWDVAAEYALLEARSLEDDLPLDRRSRHSARVRVQGLWSVARGAGVSVTSRLTGSAPIIGLGSSGPTEIGRQARYLGVDVHGSLRITSGVQVTAGVDNVFDVRPDGWQAAIGRRVRMGLQARDLF